MDKYPYYGSCTSLLNKMINEGELSHRLDHIDVMSVKPEFSTPDYEVIDNISVYRILSWKYLRPDEIKKAFKTSPYQGFKGLFYKSSWRITAKIFHGKLICREIERKVYKALKAMNASEYDAIIPVVGDFSVIKAVTRFIKKYNGPKVIVYQMDPCGRNAVLNPHFQKRRELFERNYVHLFHAILTTAIIKQEQLEYILPEDHEKIIVVEQPNIGKSSPLPVKTDVHNNVWKCIYTGKLDKWYRNPDYALSLMNEISKKVPLKFHIIGASETAVDPEYRYPDVVWHGVMNLDDTKEMISGADFLINIGNLMQNQVPSKIFEYISTGKPIINFCKTEQCPTIPYFEQYGNAINIMESKPNFENNISTVLDFMHSHVDKVIPYETIKSEFYHCTAEYCAVQLSDTIYKTATGTNS